MCQSFFAPIIHSTSISHCGRLFSTLLRTLSLEPFWLLLTLLLLLPFLSLDPYIYSLSVSPVELGVHTGALSHTTRK